MKDHSRPFVGWIVALCIACFSGLFSLPPVALSQGSDASSHSCRSEIKAVYNISYPKARGGVDSLLQSARYGREEIFSSDLPYEAISLEIKKVYNSSALQTSPFVTLWVSHSLNALLLAGFVVFVGVVVPGLMVSMWMFWECCYEVDEEDEEDNRNLSLKAQVVAGSLSVALVLSLTLLSTFLFILLHANTVVDEGVTKGGGVVGTVPPELVRLRNHSLERVFNVTRSDLYTLRELLHENILSRVSSDVVFVVNETFSSQVALLTTDISYELSQQINMTAESAFLLRHLRELATPPPAMGSEFISRLDQLTTALLNVIEQCSSVALSSGRGLEMLCDQLSSNQQQYLPQVSVGVASLGGEGSSLSRFNELVSDPLFSDNEAVSLFNDFLRELSFNLSTHVNVTSDGYFGVESPLEQRLDSFNSDVQGYYHSLSFGWPQSQEQLEIYLGERYLGNWNTFRSACTVTFVLITLLLGVCLIVAMAMGECHMVGIYQSGGEEVNIEGAHQAGNMMKKLAFGFSSLCLISSVFFGVFLCLVGVIDQGCGRHGNFSNLMQHVVDNNQTWGATFPLGAAILDNASYPLTVSGVMDGCRRNQSLFTVLQLESRYNLDDIIDIPANDSANYYTMLRSVAETIQVFNVFPSTSKLRLLSSVSALPVNWTEVTSLTSDKLFHDQFVGLDDLLDLVNNMTSAAISSNLTQSEVDTFTNITELAAQKISQFDDYIDHTYIHNVVSMATSLRDSQASLRSPQLLQEIAELEGDMAAVVPMESRDQLHDTATEVIEELRLFTSSSQKALSCDVGFCHSLSVKYDQFSSAVCNDVVQGMDLYWVTLCAILAISLLVVLISLILASRFIDLELEKSNRSNRFHLTSAVIRQIRAMFWFLLGISSNLWLVVAISQDDYFHEAYCLSQSSSCCPSCVWGFAALFLALLFILGGGGRVYQCVVLHRINKFEAMKVRRYWMDRKKATQFYTQLVHFVQDVLFLIFAGSYVSGIGTLTIPAFFSLSLSIVGVCSYLVYLVLERNNIHTYFLWIKTEAHKRIKVTTQGAEPQTGSGQGTGGQGPAMNGRRPGGPYGSSESDQSEDDSQGTTQPDADWMYNSTHPPPTAAVEHIPLPVIHEGSESMDQTGVDHLPSPPPPPGPPVRSNGVLPMAAGGRIVLQGHMDLEHGEDSDIELSQIQPTMNAMPLDNLNHSEFTASQIRLHRQQLHGGEPLSSRHTDYAASTASYYSSSNSLTAASEMHHGYLSGSQAQDDHYDSSDYREDYDSDYSHGYSQRYLSRRYLTSFTELPGEMSVEV